MFIEFPWKNARQNKKTRAKTILKSVSKNTAQYLKYDKTSFLPIPFVNFILDARGPLPTHLLLLDKSSI